MRKKGVILKAALFAVAIYLFVFQPIPYYVERPGNAIEINSMVEVDGETDQYDGKYMLTTVEMLRATPLTYFFQYLPYHTGIPESQLIGNFENYDAYRTLQLYNMENSINTAKAAAFREAGYDYTLDYQGVYVMSVSDDSNFKGNLKIGDSVTGVNGIEFSNTDEFIEFISEQTVGETVTLTVERDEDVSELSGDLIELEETGLPGIGISLVTRSTVNTDPEVIIQSGSIGGPSAGFMFALQVYTLLDDNMADIRDNRLIAGTGTIAEDGRVGRIGGVDKKVVAADKEGASLFFVPDDELDDSLTESYPDFQSNYSVALETAEAINTDMEIVPVKYLEDAISYLLEMQE